MLRLLCTFLILSGTAAAAPLLIEFDGPTMGTHYSVKAVDEARTDARADELIRSGLINAVEQRLSEINERMSTYQAESDVSRFNRAEADQWVGVSSETVNVVQRAIELSEQTGGTFDITVGPLIRLWRFGSYSEPSNGQLERDSIPSDAEVRAERSRVGYQKLKLRTEPPALLKTVPGVEIDLSAIAKGYAVDEVSRLLDNAGLRNWMVEIGGEVRVRGGKADGTAWRIGIESPLHQRRELELIVAPRDEALATSGDYRNFFTFQGRSYSHTIDPATGRPVQHSLASATVTRPTCLEADALATALLVMGPERGLLWANEHRVPALLLSRTETGVTRQQTPDFRMVASHDVPHHVDGGWGATVVMSLAIFLVAMAGMAIGVIISNRRIKGSCGGLAGLKDEQGRSICEACTNPSPDCLGDRVSPS